MTFITLVSKSPASSSSLWTRLLHLHLHSESDLNILDCGSSSMAFITLLGFASFGTSSFALVADDISADADFGFISVVQLLKSNLDFELGIWASLDLSFSSFISLQIVFSEFVVDHLLVWVGQHFIGSVDSPEELGCSFISWVFVRVIQHTLASKSLLDFSLRSVLSHSQKLVKVVVCVYFGEAQNKCNDQQALCCSEFCKGA
mmetsp:Transcript_22837/g.22677  ORF Transcript_22837/g.22677 Transcript_22837/m.22677 type:complete len:203 (-) Transcript_22837:11-619(-)